jgi:hypothetical protein
MDVYKTALNDRCKYLSHDFEIKNKFCSELVKSSFLLHTHPVLHL